MKKIKLFEDNWSDYYKFNPETGSTPEQDDYWKKAESNIEPWGNDMNTMEKLLDKYEETYGSLDEYQWDEIQEIKKALWTGYTYKK